MVYYHKVNRSENLGESDGRVKQALDSDQANMAFSVLLYGEFPWAHLPFLVPQ